MRKKLPERSFSELEANGFGATVGESVLFQDVSFRLTSGSILLLYGPRGSGKSALLRSFARLNEEIYPSVKYYGSVKVDGQRLEELGEREIRRSVTYLDTNFLESLDYLNFKELFHLVFGKERRLNVEEYAPLLDEFGVLKALYRMERTPLSSLYVLEKIGVLLFIASLKVSSLLIFDCLLDHLDDEHSERVTEMLQDLKEKGKLIIISSRTLKRFVALADSLLVMKGGKQRYFGNPQKYLLEESV